MGGLELPLMSKLGLPLAMMLGGGLLERRAANKADDQRQAIINKAAMQEEELGRKKMRMIKDFANETYDPAARMQQYEDNAAKSESSLVDALMDSKSDGGWNVAKSAEGNLSNDYTAERAKATADAAGMAMRKAKMMGRSNALGMMYNDEAMGANQMSSDVGGIDNSMASNTRQMQTDLAGVKDRGSLIGGLLTGLGTAMAMGAGGKALTPKSVKIPGPGGARRMIRL